MLGFSFWRLSSVITLSVSATHIPSKPFKNVHREEIFNCLKTSKPYAASSLVLNNNENMMQTKTAYLFWAKLQKICAKSTKLFFSLFLAVMLFLNDEGRRHFPSGMKLQWFTAHESCLALQKSSSFEQWSSWTVLFTWFFFSSLWNLLFVMML